MPCSIWPLRVLFAWQLVCIFTAVALLGRGAAATAAPPKPNIVYILADDMGTGDVRAYNPNSPVDTPNIDSIARAGMRFDNAHSSSSVCTPTRYSLLTGQYGWRSDLKSGVAAPHAPALIQPSTVTLPEVLQQSGYTTAAIGKWHLGLNWATTNGQPAATTGANVDYAQPFTGGPLDNGFDSYFGNDAINYGPYSYLRGNRTVGADLNTPDQPTAAITMPPGGSTSGRVTPGFDLHDVLPNMMDEAVSYVGQQASGPEPFFLYMPLSAPHYPIFPLSPAECPTCTTGNNYGNFIASVDHVVGRVLDALRDPNGDSNTNDSILDNTLIVFATDNGAERSDSYVTSTGFLAGQPMRGDKATVYEGGHRVPFVAQWNGHIAPESSTNHVVQLNDFMATAADLVGVNLPKGSALDSVSLASLLLGQSAAAVRNYSVEHSFAGAHVIRNVDGLGNEWKLIFSSNDGGFSGTAISPLQTATNFNQLQLYNLSTDPTEQNNLLAAGGTLDSQQKTLQLKSVLQQYILTGRSTPAPPLADVISTKTMRIDFGIDTQQTLQTGWNNVSGPGSQWPVVNMNLVDTTGASTGITLKTQWSAQNVDTGVNLAAANYDGPFPAELAGIPQSALRDGFFVRDGQKLTLTLENLDLHSAYDFLLYGTAGNTADYSLFSAAGQITQQAFIDGLLQNDDQVGLINGVIPDMFGKIVLTFEGRRPDGSLQSTGMDNDGLGRLNFLQIIANLLAVAGDYNGDRMVTMADYLVWKQSYGSANAAADGNGNGIVDAADYTVWRNALSGGDGAASGLGAGETVPEPTTFGLLLMACIVGFKRRRRL